MLKQIEKTRERFKKYNDSEMDLSKYDAENVLIRPFIEALGYDISDLDSVKSQYPCSTDRQCPEERKVDFALLHKGDFVIFVVVKSLHDTSEKTEYRNQIESYFHDEQSLYFVILTNGNEYRFFTCSKQPDVLDQEPFLVFHLTEIDKEFCEYLSLFSPQNFNPDEAKSLAPQWMHVEKIYKFLIDQISNPSDELVHHLSCSVYENPTQEIREGVKKALPTALRRLTRSEDLIP